MRWRRSWESKPYRFARTMPECPHWYTLWTSWTADGTEDAWTDELDRLWGCVVGHIRIYGVPEQYVNCRTVQGALVVSPSPPRIAPSQLRLREP